MKTAFDVTFKNDQPAIPNMGRRGVSSNFREYIHPDGTKLYIYDSIDNTAIEFLLLNSKFNSGNKDSKYIAWLYIEHILEFKTPEMFTMLMSDFSEWHLHLCGKN